MLRFDTRFFGVRNHLIDFKETADIPIRLKYLIRAGLAKCFGVECVRNGQNSHAGSLAGLHAGYGVFNDTAIGW